MTYLSRAKRSSLSKVQISVTILIICLILFLMHSFVVKTFSYLSSGLDNAIYSILPQGFKSNRDLALENQNLQSEVALLISENADRDALANENAELKSGFGRGDKEQIVYATIIKRPPGSPYDTFILDTGNESGVAIGNTVISGSVSIGTIVEVGRGYSKAELFSSPGNTFAGMLGGNIAIQARGLGGGTFEAVVPLGIDASEGESLTLPSISTDIFGLVQKVEEEPTEGFKRILFTLPINPNQIDSVGVIIK